MEQELHAVGVGGFLTDESEILVGTDNVSVLYLDLMIGTLSLPAWC